MEYILKSQALERQQEPPPLISEYWRKFMAEERWPLVCLLGMLAIAWIYGTFILAFGILLLHICGMMLPRLSKRGRLLLLIATWAASAGLGSFLGELKIADETPVAIVASQTQNTPAF